MDKLIFDMRYNGGGNSSQGTKFVERLAQALKQHPQVAVYVVLGRSFQLPSSKVLVNYSTKYFKRSEKEIETIEPDMSIEMSFADFKKGVDPVFEWIKAQ